MTSLVPDGIKLSGGDNTLAELDIQALRKHVVLVEMLQVIATSNNTFGRIRIQLTTLNLDRNLVPIIVNSEVLFLLLLLIRLENRLNEHIARLAIRHMEIRNQDTGGSNAGSVRCQVIAVLDTKVLSQAGTQHVQAGDPALSAAAVLGQHGAGGSLVHLHIDDGRRSAKSLKLLTHNDICHRNLFLLGHRHGRGERAVNAVIAVLSRLLGSDEPGILVAGGNQNEIIQANAMDAQRALIAVAVAKL